MGRKGWLLSPEISGLHGSLPPLPHLLAPGCRQHLLCFGSEVAPHFLLGKVGMGRGPWGTCLCNPCPPAPERLTPAWAAEDSGESVPDRRPGVQVQTGVWRVVSVLFSGLSRNS